MYTITRVFIVGLLFAISINQTNAQDNSKSTVEGNIENLIQIKETIVNEEKEALKAKVEAINERLTRGDITQEAADKLKKDAAEQHALNIENRIAIVDNKIELLERNGSNYSEKTDEDKDRFVIRFGDGTHGEKSIYFGKNSNKPRKYDRRTTSELVLAFGLNNALIEDESLEDSPYKIGGSRFFEIGWAWKTRVFTNSNWLRFKYGYSFQINGLKPTDDRIFTTNGNETFLEEFPHNLKKAKLTVSNLVFPVHFEFGPSKKIEREDYFRYSTHNKFKLGLGGYAGFNIGTRQKLKYKVDGERVKDKIKKNYNTSNFVYGLSGYFAFDDTAIYIKYDLSPLFKDQTIEQNNISLGIRFDMD